MQKWLLIYRLNDKWHRYVLNSRDKAMTMLNKLSKNPAIDKKELRKL